MAFKINEILLRSLRIALVLLIVTGVGKISVAQTIVYVDSSATGANSGTSWANAYTNLQQALLNSVAGNEIWVAKGTYYPSDTNRLAHFDLKDNVSMYGGFAGNETSLSQRIPNTSETILSGDIGLKGDTADNSCHVLFAHWVYENTVLDGFTVEYGHATLFILGQVSKDGGGLYLDECRFAISNCVFRYNYSTESGGAIDWGGGSQMIFTNCIFYRNVSGMAGAVYGFSGFGVMRNCHFIENSTYIGQYSNSAGAMVARSIDLYNCTFRKNHAKSVAGAVFVNAFAKLYECVFDSNYCTNGGGAVYMNEGQNLFYKCTFSNNYTTGTGSRGGALELYEADGYSNIDNCNFVNNRCEGDGGAIYIFDSRARIRNCIFNSNFSRWRGGALAFVSGDKVLTLHNSNFIKNNADSLGKAFFDWNIWYTGTRVNNCIFSNNGLPEIQRQTGSYVTHVRHSIVQTPDTGVGNIVANPSFVDTVGIDGIAGTVDDDFRLQANTVGINQGLADTSVYFLLPEDYAGNPRIIDTIDIGAYEWNNCADTLGNAIAGNDTVLCGFASQARLYASLPQNGTGRWRVIEGVGYIDTMYSRNTKIVQVLWGTTKAEWITQYCGITKRDTVTIVKSTALSNVTITAGGPLSFCTGGSVSLSVPATYTAYRWSNGATTSSITVSNSGSYSVSVTASSGCTTTGSSTVTVTMYSNPSKPSIAHSGDTVLCGNETITLNAPGGYSAYEWTNNSTASSVTVSDSGNYAVRVKNSNGCWSVYSDTTRITQFANPVKPALTLSDSNVFCAGDSVVVSTPSGYTIYNWNNNTHLNFVTLYDTYNLFLSVVDNHGCVSPNSDTVHAQKVTVGTPAVTASGAISFCMGDSVTLFAPSGYTAYHWSTNSTNSSIKVNTQGNYKVQVQNGMGCWSAYSVITTVTVHALPGRPVITVNGPLNFCQGQSIVLTSSSASSYQWSNGYTANSFSITTSGNFSVRVTNSFGCQSVYSNTVHVVVYPQPSSPVIQEGGITSFCVGASVTLTAPSGFSSYQWSTSEVSEAITVSTSGNYSLRVTDANGCQSTVSNPVTVNVFPVPAAPAITVSPQNTVCRGDSVLLTASGNYPTYHWNNGQNSPSITLFDDETLTVYATDANGCVTSNSAIVSIGFIDNLPAPVVTLQNENELTADVQANHYNWRLNDSLLNVDAQSFSASLPGTYFLIAESNGCFSDTSNKVVIECVAKGVKTEIFISPNPSDGDFSLTVNGYNSTQVKVTLFNILGQSLSEEMELNTDKCSLGNFAFNFSNLLKGVYILRLNVNGELTKIPWVKGK
ncbi:MAG: T9SS type A sorting domain-containing protein [Bacteroidota bacterium]